MTTRNWFTPGKLMLTGEYLVLNGAWSLSLPTIKGQSLTVEESAGSGTVNWKAFNFLGEVWFEGEFKLNNEILKAESEIKESQQLLQILQAAHQINPAFLSQNMDYRVSTHLDFPNDWGLGSSSTLLCNIAKWAEVDAMRLFDASMQGSGYDVAVGMLETATLFTREFGLPTWKTCTYHPDFANELFFVHQGKKQNSATSVKSFKELPKPDGSTIQKISEITESIFNANSLSEFETLLSNHEQIMAQVLNIRPLKETHFEDYKGMVKSLGAWGGDFFIATRSDAMQYFPSKGFTTIIPYLEMVKA